MSAKSFIVLTLELNGSSLKTIFKIKNFDKCQKMAKNKCNGQCWYAEWQYARCHGELVCENHFYGDFKVNGYSLKTFLELQNWNKYQKIVKNKCNDQCQYSDCTYARCHGKLVQITLS